MVIVLQQPVVATNGLSTPGNFVAENGNKLLPEKQHFVAFRATICCRFRPNLLPGVDRP